MELIDWLKIGWVAGETLGRNYMLASVIAFGGTVPEEETMLERYAEPILTAIGFFAIRHAAPKFRQSISYACTGEIR